MRGWLEAAKVCVCVCLVFFVLAGGREAGAGARSVVHRHETVKSVPVKMIEGSRRLESHVRRWRLVRPPVGRRVKLEVGGGLCINKPRPRFGRVQIRESNKWVVIVVHVITPRRSAGHESCLGVGGGIVKTVTLSRALGSRKVYDGSTHPAELRWPRRQRG